MTNVPGLRSVLNQAISAGDINQCCGLLRRIFSETAVEGNKNFLQRTKPLNRYEKVKNNPDADTIDYASLNTAISQIIELGRNSLQKDSNMVRPSSISVLCHSAQRNGQWVDALHFSQFLTGTPSPLFLSGLLNPDNTPHVLRHCRDKSWDIDVTNAIRHLSSQYGAWSSALLVAKDGERRYAGAESFSSGILVPYLANSGKTEEAKALFAVGVAQGSFTSPPLVQQLLSQTFDLGQWEVGLSMLKTLTATQETTQLLPHDVEFYRDIMEKTPHWEASLHVFHLARAAEVRPDKRMVSIAVSLSDAAGVWSEATRIYDLAKKEDFMESIALESTYHSLVRSFSAVRQWEKALEALTWMTKAGEASSAAGKCELVELCQEAGQWEAALLVGVELFHSQPELMSPQTSLSLLMACATGGRWETAVAIYHKQRTDLRLTPHPLAVCAVLQSCITAQRWSEALQIFNKAREDQTSTVLPPMAHRLAMKACVGSGQWAAVIQLLQIMKEDGLPYDNHSQRLGMWAAALGGQWELSLSYLKEIPSRSRTLQDRMIIRNATRYVGPAASSIALRYLQTK